MRVYVNPLVAGYSEIFELDSFLKLLSHLLRSSLVESLQSKFQIVCGRCDDGSKELEGN